MYKSLKIVMVLVFVSLIFYFGELPKKEFEKNEFVKVNIDNQIAQILYRSCHVFVFTKKQKENSCDYMIMVPVEIGGYDEIMVSGLQLSKYNDR